MSEEANNVKYKRHPPCYLKWQQQKNAAKQLNGQRSKFWCSSATSSVLTEEMAKKTHKMELPHIIWTWRSASTILLQHSTLPKRITWCLHINALLKCYSFLYSCRVVRTTKGTVEEIQHLPVTDKFRRLPECSER